MTFIVERRPLTPPEGRRPVLRPLRRATVREGREGDWNVSLWVGSQDEAQEIAELAVHVPLGASLLVRDNLVSTAKDLATKYSTIELGDRVARLAVDQTGSARADGPLRQRMGSLSPEERANFLGRAKTDYRGFYGMAREMFLPVSPETSSSASTTRKR